MKRLYIVLLVIFSVIFTGCSGAIGSYTIENGIYEMKEESVIIGKGTRFPLDGILTMPQTDEKVPAVLLVHGSGAHDLDETIGPNKPFLDIADYLASQGIAVLRYNKRTFTYGKEMMKHPEDITVEEEVIQDAIMAADILKNDPRIDSGRIIIVGHSLGAMLAPRIDTEGGNFAGMVFLGGSPRTLREISFDQNIASISTLTGQQMEEAQEQFEEYAATLNSLATMPDEMAKEIEIANIRGYYLKELDARPASDYLKDCTKPLLIMQGEKDISVSVEHDFNLYKQILGEKPEVTFKYYPNLNHLFMKSETGTVADYSMAGYVDQTAMEDIAEWILK